MTERLAILEERPIRIVLAYDSDEPGQKRMEDIAGRVLDQTRPLVRRRWGDATDWELQAELEHWRRLYAEYPAESEQLPYALQHIIERGIDTKAELQRRSRLQYQRAKSPWDLEEYTRRVKESADLLAVIGSRCPEALHAKRQGQSVTMLCPFHSENTPSFCISHNLYHCFGCGEGGDAIEFVRKYENLMFVQALFTLGDELGIARPAVRIQGVEVFKPNRGANDGSTG